MKSHLYIHLKVMLRMNYCNLKQNQGLERLRIKLKGINSDSKEVVRLINHFDTGSFPVLNLTKMASDHSAMSSKGTVLV